MEWFNYLLKVSACSTLLFAFYLLILRRLTFFKINRFYLLSSLLLSFIIPALQFKVEREAEAIPDTATMILENHKPLAGLNAQLNNKTNLYDLAVELFNAYSFIFYAGVVAILLLLATFKLIKLFRHLKTDVKNVNGLKLVNKVNGFTNCSFFNYVFINEDNLSETELNVLLKHEEIHAKQYHSADKIILMIVKAVLWFNPVIYLYDKALEQVHEYEADEATSANWGKENYAGLLLKLTISHTNMPFTHNFVKSPIKNRIIMLFNSKSKNMKKLTYLLALPIVFGLLWVFSANVVYAQNSKNEVIELPINNNEEKDLMSLTKAKSKLKSKDQVIEVEMIKKQPKELVKEVVLETDEKIEEVVIRDSFYERYEMIDNDGNAYDEVKITLNSKGSGTAFVPKKGKVIIIINGIKYTENEVMGMDKGIIKDIKSISVIEQAKSIKVIYPELAGKCDAVIQLPSVSVEEFEKIRTKN